MTVDERALPERISWPATPVGAGEVFYLHEPAQAAELSHRCATLMAELRRMKMLADEALRDELASKAAAKLIVSADLEVEEEPGRVSYDGEALYSGLVAAGLEPDVVAEMFKPVLRDARELGKLERRNDAVAKAAEAARTRSRGRVVVKRKKGRVAGEAAIPEEVHRQAIDEARSNREAETEASDLGI